MVESLVDVGLIVLSLSTIVVAARIIMGPTLPDRVVAADGATSQVIGITVLVGMKLDSVLFFDIAIALAILSFVMSVVVGKYLAEGEVINGDTD